MRSFFILLFVFLAFSIRHAANAAPLSGTKSVGPTGDYTSITAAIADVQAVGNGLGGALILELQATYVSTVETFPLTLPALNGSSVVNTLTIRPSSGAAALSITSANTTAATVDLNGAQFVMIDGRAGGAGTAKQLTIANTSTSGVALRFINEASSNIIEYITLQGVNSSAASGVVFFSTTTGTNGNDHNTIDHCDIRDGTTTPINGLFASGTDATTAQNNSDNTVTNCNIFNFHAATAVDSAGVRLDSGNTDWTLTGNSFYQTASHTGVGAFLRPIYLNNASGNNFTITSNFIGGSAPNGGGTAWITTFPSALYRFVGIHLNIGTTTPSSVQGNNIANIVWTSNSNGSTLPGTWSGIYAQAGAVNIGTETGNTIGNSAGTGSISVTTTGSGGTSFGIGSASSGTVAIANNTIGSITVNGTSTTGAASFTGILVTAGVNTISNNTVGSTTVANSLNAATSSTSASGQQVTGILSSSSTSTSITGNTVANLNNNYTATGSAGQIRGIVASAGVNTITGNNVRNLSTTSQNTSTSTFQSVLGIIDSSTLAGQTVSQNVVHSLANTATAAAVTVTGIYFAGPTSGTNVIARNLVHSLAISSTSTGSVLRGMQFDAGIFTAQNNMVRVGLDASGNPTAGASFMQGIFDNGATSGRNFYHSSVYLGGTQTSGTNTTLAFSSNGVSNTRTFQNNIFVNVRSASGGTGKHYAVSYGGTTVNPAGLTAGGNLFLASGTGGMLGRYNSSIDCSTLAAWQAATGQDASSAVADPRFVNPTGGASAVDLHLQASNPAEGGGIPVVAVTEDFDGQARSAFTPADIGADAGNFFLFGSDIFAPGISYTPLASGTTANRVLTDWADITDGTGVSGGTNAPRLYFKKSTDADVFNVANNSTGNGWKYVTATGSGPYSFMLDYSLINGGSASNGDTIQYFVVAQDDANNLSSSPAGATASANPPLPNVNGHGAVNSFIIFPGSGTVTVGSNGDYDSLSGTGGLFAAINDGILTGDIVVNITSDVIETGSVTLNQWSESGTGNYTLTIRPDSATMRTISGNAATGLITLNGSDRVVIDGSFGGSGRYLTFRNTNIAGFPSSSTILFINDASGNEVRNCVVEGAIKSLSLGVIGFSTGTVTGNDDNRITGCQVRDLSTTAGVPYTLIGSSGSSASVANSNNNISNNELFNFDFNGIAIGTQGNDSWTLSGNNIYEVNAAIVGNMGIYMDGGGTNVITDNFIHDLLTNGLTSNGIYARGPSTTTIARNLITAFNVNVATTTVYGIRMFGTSDTTNNVVNNQIILMPAASTSSTMYGIYTSNSNAYYNSIVLGGTESGTASSWACYCRDSAILIARNNLFLNLRTGGTGSHFAIGSEGTPGTIIASHNIYAGTGATVATDFMDYSNTFGTAVPVDFATWQSSTGDTNSQAGLAGSGSFTTAMFVDAANGDLHLVPGGNALVNGAGTPIAGLTTDFDGDIRSASSPVIGADEIPLPDIAVAQTSALADGAGSVDFGSVTLGSSSTAKIFTVTNPGIADLSSLVVSKIGTDAGDFTVSALSATSIPVGNGTATFTVTFSPGSSGAKTAAIHIGSNVIGAKNPFDITLTGTGQTPMQAVNSALVAAGLSGPNAALNATPYGDGVANLLKYAFNMNLSGPDASTMPPSGNSGLPGITVQPNGGASVFRFEFLRRKNSGLIYTPQKSSELANPTSWVPLTDLPTVISIDATWERVIYEEPYDANTIPRCFGRVQVSLP